MPTLNSSPSTASLPPPGPIRQPHSLGCGRWPWAQAHMVRLEQIWLPGVRSTCDVKLKLASPWEGQGCALGWEK